MFSGPNSIDPQGISNKLRNQSQIESSNTKPKYTGNGKLADICILLQKNSREN